MESRVSRFYFLIPAIYVCLIAGLLYLHFSQKEGIQGSVSGITITATKNGRSADSPISSLSLGYRGFRFPIGMADGITINLVSGNQIHSTPVRYAADPQGYTVYLTHSLQIQFSAETEPESLSILMSGELSDVMTVEIPFETGNLEVLTRHRYLPEIVIASEKQGADGYLCLSGSDETAITQNSILLRGSTAISEGLLVTTQREPPEFPGEIWLTTRHSPPSTEIVEKVISDYLNQAYRGWIDSRFDPQTGEWSNSATSQTFSESLVVALIAETYRRGDSGTAIQAAKAAYALHSEEAGFFSSPYLGNIVDADSEGFDSQIIEQLGGLVENGDSSLFMIPHLLQILVDFSPYPLRQSVFAFAGAIDPPKENLAVNLGLLRLLLESRQYSVEGIEVFSRFSQIPLVSLMAALDSTDRGLFIRDGEGQVSVGLTIEAGRLLVMLGDADSNTLFSAVGRSLLYSGLTLADAEGFLPETLVISDGKIQDAAGLILPETIYQSMAPSAFFPHSYSLHAIFGPGTWIWTAADFLEVTVTDGGLDLSFSFPAGESHHFALRGLAPFTELTLFGIPWNSDPRFQIYSSGWLYDAQSETLYAKITHRSQREKLQIRY